MTRPAKVKRAVAVMLAGIAMLFYDANSLLVIKSETAAGKRRCRSSGRLVGSLDRLAVAAAEIVVEILVAVGA